MAYIDELTLHLFGEKFFSEFDSKEYVNWAIQLLIHGYENESLSILASLDNSPTWEREKYFYKSLKELNISEPPFDFSFADIFMKDLAHKVINKLINLLRGLRLAYGVVLKTDYDKRFIQFYYLDEDIQTLEFDNKPFYSVSLNQNNIDSFIINEFKLWLDFITKKIDDWEKLAYCHNCDGITKPILRKRYRFLRGNYEYWSCEKCKSSKLLHAQSQEGRKKIIEFYNK